MCQGCPRCGRRCRTLACPWFSFGSTCAIAIRTHVRYSPTVYGATRTGDVSPGSRRNSRRRPSHTPRTMMSPIDPPFRADHVGSLLRPAEVVEARSQCAAGEISAAQLREVEDHAIAAAVSKMESLGMRSITDGEFRRGWFHLDFLQQLDGVAVTGNIAASSDAAATVHLTPPKLSVVGPLRHVRDIQVDDYRYLASVTTQTPKV